MNNSDKIDNYFPDYERSEKEFYRQSQNQLLLKIRYYLIQIWPYINKSLNFIFYWILRTIKGIVKYGLRQIGLIKE